MLISIAIILILSITIGLFFKKKAVECIPFVIMSIIFILYVFGIFRLLIIGLYVIYGITVITTIYTGYILFTDKQKVFDCVSIGLVVYVALLLFLFCYVNGSVLMCLDEFTAWGLQSKIMFESNQLYIFSGYPMLAKHYQSATGIFQYFLVKNNFNYSESLVLMSTGILYFSMACTVLRDLKIKDIFEIVMRAAVIFIIPISMYMWPSVYYTILVDVIIGIAFSYILYYYFTNDYDLFTIINLSLICFFLANNKANGLVLIVLAAFIIFIDLLFFKKHFSIKINIHFTKDIFSKINYKELLLTFLPVFMSLFTYISWQICVNALDLMWYDSSETIGLFGKLTSKEFLANSVLYFDKIILIYKEYESCLIIFLVLGIALLIYKNYNLSLKEFFKKYVRAIIMVLLFLFCCFIYVIFLFLVVDTMASIFISLEALRRYFFTVVAACLFLGLFLVIHFHKVKKFNYVTLAILIVLSQFGPASWQISNFLDHSYRTESIDYREPYDLATEQILNYVNVEKDIVYIVREIDNDSAVLYYSTFPFVLYFLPKWKKSTTYQEYKEFLENKEVLELYEIINDKEKKYIEDMQNNQGESYIYVYGVTEEFLSIYGEIFEDGIQERTLYKLDFSNDKISVSKVE